MIKSLLSQLSRPLSITPLVSFRICFGMLMFFSIIRFWWRGWVTALYVSPKFHFTYNGFEWVKPLGLVGTHVLFLVIAITSLMIALGLFYRAAAIVFFLGFTYVELIDVTTYLNHYYFISLVAFLMIWLPAAYDFSLDVKWGFVKRKRIVPGWAINILRFQLAVVYVFAGLAKLNADWLLHAQPMRTWLPAKTHLPFVGGLLYQSWVAYLFSWFGALYDLFIVLFLVQRKTRPYAYFFVLVFHVATAVFFPAIGLFPYIMIVCSLIFFHGRFHEKLLSFIPGYTQRLSAPGAGIAQPYRFPGPRLMAVAIGMYVLVQVLVPLRFMLYPGHLFWHEEGYRFSWRVMLMEKSGATYFRVKNNKGKMLEVNNAAFLTPLQEKMMSTQPDMILKYARHLAQVYRGRGIPNPQVYAEVYVSINGQRSRLFIDSTVNLAGQAAGWQHYSWVLPYKNSNGY